MKNKAKPATPEQKRRFEAMKLLGCYCCIVDGQQVQCGYVENHHNLAGSVRLGHDDTVPLGLWHHQGVSDGLLWDNSVMLRVYGPSYHKHRRSFRARYGQDHEVVEKVNALLAERGLYYVP